MCEGAEGEEGCVEGRGGCGGGGEEDVRVVEDEDDFVFGVDSLELGEGGGYEAGLGGGVEGVLGEEVEEGEGLGLEGFGDVDALRDELVI